ncbi:cupredoxin domain-containing protein [Legionella brunensis]|uniref:Plastocyanin n=1 Tax=Legionella brunensis TaxID=29422 RepID=A0A0W0SNY9_9GAMM|nr:cupredoxin domain-containing protein [Legionella brunensis]KTC84972.1 Plastocyanin precursor [Legionella brunensis]
MNSQSCYRYPLLITLAICLLSPAPFVIAKGATSSKVVVMKEDYFSPKTLTIIAGQKVIWVNKGEDEHTVKSKSAGFFSGDIDPGGSFSYTFIKPGRYKYICTHHTLFGFGMRGEIIVK